MNERYRQQFHQDGFVIVKNVLSKDEVDILSKEAETLVNYLIGEDVDIMTRMGGVIEPVSCGYIDPPLSQMFILSKRSYSAVRDLISEPPNSVTGILFDTLPEQAKHFLPASASLDRLCLFNEQYIIKTPRSASVSSFVWHQDSQYMDESSRDTCPMVSCWTALDDMNAQNGTLIIEPFPRPIDQVTGNYLALPDSLNDNMDVYLGYHIAMSQCYGPELDLEEALAKAQTSDARTRDASSLDETTGRHSVDFSDPAQFKCERQRTVLVQVPAGSTVFLSGFVRHCSLGNGSQKFRKAFMPQYSMGAVRNSDGGLISMAVPCVE